MVYELFMFLFITQSTLLEYEQNAQTHEMINKFVHLWYFATFGHIKIITLNTLKTLLLWKFIYLSRKEDRTHLIE